MSDSSPASALVGITTFLLVAFAGCVSNEPTQLDIGDGPQAAWKAPALPVLDARALLADHKEFVKTFPSRRENQPTHVGARDALAKELSGVGLEVWRQDFFKEIQQQNVCAIKVGIGKPEEWIVVGAHYDTDSNNARALANSQINRTTNGTYKEFIPETVVDQVLDGVSEGAYDDGSGTWMVVDLAKRFARQANYYSLAFCLFDGEERGLQGSQAFKKAMDDGTFPYAVSETRAMLDLDMFGLNWPVRAPIVMDHNNFRLVAEVEKLRVQLGIPKDMIKYGPDELELMFYHRPLGQSDYRWWYRTETATAFFISDFARLAPPFPGGQPTPSTPVATVPGLWVPGAYPFWHLMDTYENMERMAGGPVMLEAGFQTAIQLAAGVLDVMANHPEIDFGDSH